MTHFPFSLISKEQIMNSLKSLTAAGLLSALAVAGTPAQAAITAAVDEPTGATRTDHFAWVGFAFSTPDDTAVNVNRLGFWDEGGDGLISDHEVALFEFDSFTSTNQLGNGNFTLIATATVSAGTAAPLEGGYRWASISDMVLFKTAAQNAASSTRSYLIMFNNVDQGVNDPWTDGLGDAVPINPAFGTVDSRGALVWTGGTTVGSTGVSSQAGVPQFGGPNIGYEAPVPEPSSLALIGLGGLAVLRRRRSN